MGLLKRGEGSAHAQFVVVCKGRLDGLRARQCAVESVEGVETVLGAASGGGGCSVVVVVDGRHSCGFRCCRLLVEGADHVDCERRRDET